MQIMICIDGKLYTLDPEAQADIAMQFGVYSERDAHDDAYLATRGLVRMQVKADRSGGLGTIGKISQTAQ